MDEQIYIPSALVGMVFVAVYSFRKKSSTSTTTIISILLHTFGGGAGVMLILSTFFPDRFKLEGIKLYILIAGIALISIAVQNLINDVFFKNGKDTGGQ